MPYPFWEQAKKFTAHTGLQEENVISRSNAVGSKMKWPISKSSPDDSIVPIGIFLDVSWGDVRPSSSAPPTDGLPKLREDVRPFIHQTLDFLSCFLFSYLRLAEDEENSFLFSWYWFQATEMSSQDLDYVPCL